MDTPNVVVPPGQDPVSRGRSFSLKLRGGETGDSIMMFEETVPAGTKSTFHLRPFMPRGVPHAWKRTGAETGRVLFL